MGSEAKDLLLYLANQIDSRTTAAERERDIALNEMRKVTTAIETKAAQFGIEWHGSAERMMQAVLEEAEQQLATERERNKHLASEFEQIAKGEHPRYWTLEKGDVLFRFVRTGIPDKGDWYQFEELFLAAAEAHSSAARVAAIYRRIDAPADAKPDAANLVSRETPSLKFTYDVSGVDRNKGIGGASIDGYDLPLDKVQQAVNEGRKLEVVIGPNGLESCELAPADAKGGEPESVKLLREWYGQAGVDRATAPAAPAEEGERSTFMGQPYESIAPSQPAHPETEKACDKCGQLPDGQGGEYPCPACGIPTLHDQCCICQACQPLPAPAVETEEQETTIEIDGKRYRREAVARLPKKGETFWGSAPIAPTGEAGEPEAKWYPDSQVNGLYHLNSGLGVNREQAESAADWLNRRTEIEAHIQSLESEVEANRRT